MQMSLLVSLSFCLLIIFLYFPWIVADNFASTYSNTSLTEGSSITRPGCPSKCGDLTVPFPFGIGSNSGCSVSPFFTITCDASFNPPKAFIGTDNLEVLGISETNIRIRNRLAVGCYDEYGNMTEDVQFFMNLSSTPFSFSNENMLTVVGCDDVALLSRDGDYNWTDFISSCVAVCSKPGDLSNGFCSGIGCCQASLPKGLQFIYATMATLNAHSYVYNFSHCGFSFLAEKNSYTFNISDISDSSFASRIVETVPLVLDWAIGIQTCDQIWDKSETICQGNSICVDSGSIVGGYRCNCSQGYQGNPYLSPGLVMA